MAKKVILTDMDDVLNNFCSAWVDAIGEKYGEYRDINEITEWDVWKFYAEIDRESLYKIIHEPDFWFRVTMKSDALKYIPMLQKHFDVYVVTATSYSIASVKIAEFLKAFTTLDEEHIIIANNKKLVNGDYFIDDGIHNLVDHGAPYKMVFDTPSNRIPVDAEKALGLHRVYGWKEIYDTIMKREGFVE